MAKKNNRADHLGPHRQAFEKNKKIILQTQEICAICGNPVDPAYKYPHPLSATVDHIIPLAKGGHPSDINNLQLAHLWCNRWKADRITDSKPFTADKAQKDIGNNVLPLHFDWFAYGGGGTPEP